MAKNFKILILRLKQVGLLEGHLRENPPALKRET
jgi:hypothetical protein